MTVQSMFYQKMKINMQFGMFVTYMFDKRSLSLRSVHGNVEIHVLFEKLTATVVLNFMRCHLKTIDNGHVMTIHIQYNSFGINFHVDSN